MSREDADLDQRIAGIASLGEPMRRSLYLFVSHSTHDVSRDEAAEALGISRALAAFHLDKLAEEGLLETRFQRLTGRTGPGAGRPAKLYRRSSRQFEISLPPRSYELAARLFARTLSNAGEHPASTPLADVAHDWGAAIGSEARQLAGNEAGTDELLNAAQGILEMYGYEPQRDADGQ